uniref:U80-Liphistoxin-Lth1a_1 n=1 Tax=Liphistius thaleban TaxID=1905330 RepID=A0A4Q8K508_9ARAC
MTLKIIFVCIFLSTVASVLSEEDEYKFPCWSGDQCDVCTDAHEIFGTNICCKKCARGKLHLFLKKENTKQTCYCTKY